MAAMVQSIIGRRKVWFATLINSMLPGLAVAFAFYYWNKPKPNFVFNYWLIYCAITLASAIAMWYVPYFRGAPEKTRHDYLTMYAGTRQVLPARGDNPRPNLLHICFHVLFVVTFILAVILRLRSA
jgi:hypothetical protein